MATARQFSFASGEIAPALYARADQSKYASGLRVCENFVVMRHGGATNRPGTEFVAQSRPPSAPSVSPRLVPFAFQPASTFCLEFGEGYVRFYRAGTGQAAADAQVTDAASGVPIVALSQANPAVVSHAGPLMLTGQEVRIAGAAGMTQVNGRNFRITVLSPATFSLQELDGTNVDSTGFGAYAGGGAFSRVLELATPFVAADLPTLQFTQILDSLVVVSASSTPRRLRFVGPAAYDWTVGELRFDETTIPRPASGSATTLAPGAGAFRFRVCAVDKDTGEESLPGRGATVAIFTITNGTPIVVTTTGPHGLSNGDEVYITGAAGMTEVNNSAFIVTVVSPTVVNLFHRPSGTVAVSGAAFGAHTAGTGLIGRTWIDLTLAGTPNAANPHIITWAAVAGAAEYNVYKDVAPGTGTPTGVFGFIGTAVGATTTFNDVNQTPDVSNTPPEVINSFNTGFFRFSSGSTVLNAIPTVTALHQQRLVMAGSVFEPETLYVSQTGLPFNFTSKSPAEADDAFKFRLQSTKQVSRVRHAVSQGPLIVFTEYGEWTVDGETDRNLLTPDSINPRQHTFNGSSDRAAPLVANGSLLYVQRVGAVVRDLAFELSADGYRGNDLTTFSAHLVDGRAITDWAFQLSPHSVVWAVRDDGQLIGLTYVREHSIAGWHRHLYGTGVRAVAVVQEPLEDRLFLVVERTAGGKSVRHVERAANRTEREVSRMLFTDDTAVRDGTNTAATTMTLTGGVDWVSTETLTLTSSAAVFDAASVGDAVHLTGPDGTVIRFSIEGFTGPTVVTGRPHKTVPAGMRAVALSSWGYAERTITGLWHLEGRSVAVYGDGFVAASPLNPAYPIYTVAGGAITLDRPYVRTHTGLAVRATLVTLNLDVAQGETLADKRKLVTRQTVFVESTRGMWLGTKAPSDDDADPLEGLVEKRPRLDEGYDSPPRLLLDQHEVNVRSGWDDNGRAVVRQVDPVPVSVLSVAPAGMLAPGR